MKKILSVLLTFCLLGALCCSFAGCGGPSTTKKTDRGETFIVTVYRARSAGMADGERDAAVKAAIEEKFWKDTGVSIELDVQIYTNTQITDIVDVNFNNKNKNIDAICHYISEDDGSAIAKYAKDVNSVKNLDPLLEEYGKNYLAAIQKNDEGHLADRAGYFPDGNGNYNRTMLSSVTKEGGFGILMRKDLMKNVQAKTGLDPEDYDITSENYKSMTVSEFEKVMRAIKEDSSNSVTTPVNGAPWDLGRVVAPAYGADGMTSFAKNASGKFVPSHMTENWGKYVDLMYRWANSGIWESESSTTTDDQRQTNLIAGTAAAYLAYPTAEELITLSKKFYAANPEQELMVIAPFASEDQNGNALLDENGKQIVNGNLKVQRSFYGAIIPYRSANADKFVQFMDWMFSDAENYDLCRYGVKGVDWVEGDDYVYNGTTYKTWAYPDNKSEEYLNNPPYSGKYLFIDNINVSNRMSAHYNTTEKVWYSAMYNEFPVFGNTELEGIWLPEVPRSLASQEQTITGDYTEEIRSYAWVGKKNQDKTPAELLVDFVAKWQNDCKAYLDFIDSSYKSAIAYFNQKYAD